ncbi:MAG: 8-oxo-dGTP diphosphatase [Actinomycetota bacterium]|nr:MutT/nudix family protein [Glaciihabitans sp.]MDQ1555072.1 8-oxo-dGTP diphosphatase [Actinomycetota bacterium]
MPPVLRIAAALIHDPDGRMLLVRKRGTTMWMQPGGKLEPDETAADCLARELGEELGLLLDPATFAHVGRFDAAAANEPGHVVDCDVFTVPYPGVVLAAAEIEAAGWFTAAELRALPLAPLTRDNFL